MCVLKGSFVTPASLINHKLASCMYVLDFLLSSSGESYLFTLFFPLLSYCFLWPFLSFSEFSPSPFLLLFLVSRSSAVSSSAHRGKALSVTWKKKLCVQNKRRYGNYKMMWNVEVKGSGMSALRQSVCLIRARFLGREASDQTAPWAIKPPQCTAPRL